MNDAAELNRELTVPVYWSEHDETSITHFHPAVDKWVIDQLWQGQRRLYWSVALRAIVARDVS